jgi:hypothetical protein
MPDHVQVKPPHVGEMAFEFGEALPFVAKSQ